MPANGRRDSIIGINRYWPKFLAISKDPEVKVPRRCRGHVRLKYIDLGVLASDEQCVVILFLTVKQLSAMDITAEADGVYRHKTLSFVVVKKRRKRFVNGRITLEDDPQLGRPPRNDLCESLRAIFDEIPIISCKYM
jgi:hypothetical protein